MRPAERGGLSTTAVAMILLLVGLAAVAEAYVTSTQSTADLINAQSRQVSMLQSEMQKLASEIATSGGSHVANLTLPVMNQPPTIRTIRETWYLSPSAHQDRFEPSFIVVNQGDTIRLALIENDTVAHDFVIGPPYNIIVNATVPGLVNDLTGQKFTTPSRNNSPGVVVEGRPGNVTASYAFVASYSGIYEFVCTYHAQVGMIGYLVVLPNAAYSQATTTSAIATTAIGATVAVSITPGALNPPNRGYSQDSIVVVIGVNNTVTWNNNDSSIHTVTANDGSFDSGYLDPGASFIHVFTKPGTYEYHCQLHPWMIGYVTVKSS